MPAKKRVTRRPRGGFIEQQNKELQASLAKAISDYKSLSARYDDLSAQNEELRTSPTLSPAELAQITAERQQFRALNENQNAIALWLRENRNKEMRRGLHADLTFPQTIIMYLARGLQYEIKEREAREARERGKEN